MRKFKNSPLYLLFLVNCISAIRHGIDWLFCVAALLTVMDILEAAKHGRKE